MFSEILAIDPWALILPSRIYVIFAEKNHPHEPSIAHLAEAIKEMTPEEKSFTRARLNTLNAYTGAVGEVLSHTASA